MGHGVSKTQKGVPVGQNGVLVGGKGVSATGNKCWWVKMGETSVGGENECWRVQNGCWWVETRGWGSKWVLVGLKKGFW